jgi:hypothetical protein
MKKYTVKKGEFYFRPRTIGIHFGVKEKQWKVRFNQSNLYNQIDPENDWNKGAGWSYGLDIHKNSIRWAWRADKTYNAIEICIYMYQDGIRTTSKESIYVPIDQDIFIRLRAGNGAFASLFTREFETGIRRNVTAPFIAKAKIGRWSGLYFGGNNPSPIDQHIHMDKVKLQEYI